MGKMHSVLLKEDKCEGCTNCVKNCPTKAIRVHQGKAIIKEELCIDCAECIRTCVYHAKYARTGDLEEIREYPRAAVLVPPSFYGQFKPETGPALIRAGLKELGFQEVYDVALAAEAVSRMTADFLAENEGLYISSSCPVVVRLIQLKYPELVEQLLPIKPPVELMAEVVKKGFYHRGEGLEGGQEKPAVFLLTPCPAKATTVSNPPGMESSFLDGAVAVDKVYRDLLEKIKEISGVGDNALSRTGRGDYIRNDSTEGAAADQSDPRAGLKWGRSGGEETLLKSDLQEKDSGPDSDRISGRVPGVLSVSGIKNVRSILEEVSRDNLKGLRYLELNACPQGCVGGVLNAVNPFQAAHNLQELSAESVRPVKQDDSLYQQGLYPGFKAAGRGSLDENLDLALEKLVQLEKELELLPGLDCAACGAPDCETLAEDIVNGLAERSDCIFVLRDQVGDLADTLSRLAHALPPVMRRNRGDKGQ